MGQNDFYVGYFYNTNYLAHHGILGMHWGRRNGPPYPLDASDHSSSEKKAGWRKSLGSGRNESLYDRKINRLRRAAAASNRDADDLKKHGYHKESEAVRKVAEKNNAKADRVQKLRDENNGKMSKRQKIVAGVAGAMAVKSAVDTVLNYRTANALAKELTENMGHIPVGSSVAKGLIQAGKVAAVAGLATYGVIKLNDYVNSPEKKIARTQKKIDKLTSQMIKNGTKFDSNPSDLKNVKNYRKTEAKYYKELNKAVSKYDVQNTNGPDEYAHYKIMGQKKQSEKVKGKYGNLGSVTEDYINRNNPNKKQQAKDTYKTEKRRIQERYDRGIEAIESKYKKYENLSPEDSRKEEQLEKEYHEAWDAAKKRYKQARQ